MNLLTNGPLLAFAGAAIVVTLGAIGSVIGIRISASQAAGILSEKPELFGKLFVIMALPGTQGFYGFVSSIMIVMQAKLIGDAATALPASKGIALFAVGFGVGMVQLLSAIGQGMAAAAAENLVAKQPDEAGKAILIPALVETYAVLALVSGILLIMWIVGANF